jgi:hypothetical protein
MRIQKEQSGSTSLFAHSMAMEPIPEAPMAKAPMTEAQVSDATFESARSEDSQLEVDSADAAQPEAESSVPAKLAHGALVARMETVLAKLAEPIGPTSATICQGHLALLKRWYYRAEIRRAGEIFFPDAEGRWPIKTMLRGVGRVFACGFKSPATGA